MGFANCSLRKDRQFCYLTPSWVFAVGAVLHHVAIFDAGLRLAQSHQPPRFSEITTVRNTAAVLLIGPTSGAESR
jgi:hypothetical protein